MIVLWVVSDLLRLDTLKKHQKCKLIRKEDVRQYQLLFWSCRQVANQRFDYLVDWDPEALKNSLLAGKPLIHAALDRDDENMETFAMLLKAGMKYLPEHLGLLFRKNSLGTTACEFAFEQQGKDETFKVIQERIPADSDYPVLHHVITHTPHYMDDFTLRYPSAIFLRDENQHCLLHAALSSGTHLNTDAVFILRMRDYEIEEIDPVTELYPFAIAASAAEIDLFTIFHLLRRNPRRSSSKKRTSGKAGTLGNESVTKL